MKSFLKLVFATIIGIFIFCLLAFFILAGVGGGSSAPKISSNSILNIKLVGDLPDLTNEDPFSNLSLLSATSFSADPVIGLKDIKDVLKNAASDDKIKAIVLNTDELTAMPANALELVNSLQKFKESGKLLYAYSNNLSELSLIINSIADKSYLNPMGHVEFNGMASEITYYTGLFEKLKVQPMIFYAGKFKSATEPFRLKSMSPENRLQVETYLGSIYNNLLSKLSANRKVSVDSLKQLADNMSIFFAEDAVKHHLVDGLKYKDELESELKEKFGYKESDDLKLVSLKTYLSSIDLDKSLSKSKNKIAVIYAEGEIKDGNTSSIGTIYEGDYTKMIRKAYSDKDVKAIVLRVNSPGGSAFASEQILREVQNAQKKKIPVVVSMGNLAASGGYYISSLANKIVAEPTTITGSIGVFGMMFNVEKALETNLGLSFDRVKTSPHADFGSATRPWDDLEKEKMTQSIQETYHIFLKHVADGRKMSIEDVDKIAQGRVWTGQDALKLGLVDTLGNLNTAISMASKLAKIDTYQIKNFPEAQTTMEMIMAKIMGNDDESINDALAKTFGDKYVYFKQIAALKDMGNQIQARVPYDIRFK